MTDQREHGITWTDTTWNPIRGCSRVSEGCRNCYAERVARRFSAPGQPYEGLVRIANGHPQWTGEVRVVDEHMLDPLRWRRPRRIFVNSMSDLFHENVSYETIDRIFAVMALCPQHTFQVLTKRPERMLRWFEKNAGRNHSVEVEAIGTGRVRSGCWMDPLPNVWLGVSVEDQKTADERIPLLLQTPAAVRWISAEPLLGPITFRWAKWDTWRAGHPHFNQALIAEGHDGQRAVVDHLDGLRMLDWVVAGGESGPGARPMHPDWARSLRDQCVAAGVAFHFKQWGEWGPGSVRMNSGDRVFRQFDSFQQWVNKADTWVNGGICLDAQGLRCRNGEEFSTARYPVTVIHRVGKKAAGRLLDGREWNEYPGVKEEA